MQWLGKHVSQLGTGGNREKMNKLGLKLFSNNMAVQLNMLASFMERWIMSKIDG
ncbi:hypothetical protein A2U01_0055574 [Trifolium medium]|uniref:Uncharacterized protein n=1 Tax=Trifolium medium TaxID=97028 RepID=A0A392RFJ3_9FABA|nr:hypothetical protein [Trifolium medium]